MQNTKKRLNVAASLRGTKEKQKVTNNHNRIVIPSSKYIVSRKFGNKVRIFIHEEFVPPHYYLEDFHYKGIILPTANGKYYEFKGNANLFVKKNIRVEDYIKNALYETGIIDDISMSKYTTKSILDTEGVRYKLFSHNMFLSKQITIYLHIGLYFFLLKKHYPINNLSKIIRNILYRSLGFIKTVDFDNRPTMRGDKDVA